MTFSYYAVLNRLEITKPDQASFRIHKGDASLAAGQLDQAITEYNQAIKLAPSGSDGFIGRGTVRLRQQKVEEALADFDEAVRLNPNSLLAYNNRGDAHFSLRQFDLAIADFNHVIDRDPNAFQAYCNRGNAYAAKGALSTAIDDLTKATSLPTCRMPTTIAQSILDEWETRMTLSPIFARRSRLTRLISPHGKPCSCWV